MQGADQALSLPPEVWRRIADQLSMQEYARLISICQALQHLQRESLTVDITDKHREAAMRFLLKRWGSSPNLKLHFETFISAWANSLPPQAAALRDVRILVIVTSIKKNNSRSVVWGYFMAWVAWVLVHCTSLKFFGLSHTGPGTLPPLAALRHLELWSLKHRPEMFASLLQCKGLQTLRVGHGDSHVMECPVLQLTELQSLQHVSLYNTYPQRLAMPPECTVHYGAFAQEVPSAAFLDSVNHALVGITVKCPLLREGDVAQQDRGPMQGLLEQLGGRCADLRWSCRAFGNTLLPLRFPASLACLRELYLSGTSISIHLPAELRLQGCHLHATQVLDVALDDPAVLAWSLVDLSLVYSQPRGGGLMRLFWQLGNAGKRVVPLFRDGEARGMQMKGSRVPSVLGAPWCACGACLPCLRQSGRL